MLTKLHLNFLDIDFLAKTVDICKSSIGMVGRRLSLTRPASPQRLDERPSWENEILDEGMVQRLMSVAVLSCHLAIANSSLPVVQQAARNRRVSTDCQADRMNIWLQGVESASANYDI